MKKFKVGDVVKGIRSRKDGKYNITTSDMTKARVFYIGDDGKLAVKVIKHKTVKDCVGELYYGLDPEDFDYADSLKRKVLHVLHRQS